MRLAGRIVLIAGGASGIGRATALRVAGDGARVVVADLNETEGGGTVAAIRSAGGEARFIRCDVTQEADARAAVAAAKASFGGMHVLINSAGILQGAFQPVEELELETFARVMNVNVLGTFLISKHAVPLIEASGGGVILCIASGAGIRGPSSSLPYGASKAGVHGFCMTLERNLAPRGIRVNVVCPGSLDTPMKRQNVMDGAIAAGQDPHQALAGVQLGDPDGIARILAFLASSDADYLLGTVVTR